MLADTYNATSIRKCSVIILLLFVFTPLAAPVLMTTDPKDGVLKPAMYPPEIEALAADVLQSYQDSPTCSEPFVSPYMAPPEMWKGLPPIHLVVSTHDCCTPYVRMYVHTYVM